MKFIYRVLTIVVCVLVFETAAVGAELLSAPTGTRQLVNASTAGAAMITTLNTVTTTPTTTTYVGTLTGTPSLDTNYYSYTTVLQEIKQGDLPISALLVQDAAGRTKILLKENNSGKIFLLGKDLVDAGVNLKNIFFEGTERVVSEKTFLSTQRLPVVYALTSEISKPSRLVSFYLDDGVLDSKEVDGGLIEKNSYYSYATPFGVHVAQAFSRFNYSNEIYYTVEGADGITKLIAADVSGQLLPTKGGDLTGIQTKIISDPQYSIKGSNLSYNGIRDDIWIAYVAVIDGIDQVVLWRNKAGVETSHVITKSLFAKFKPVIQYAQGAVAYTVQDEISGYSRVAIHAVADLQLNQAITACPEYYVTTQDFNAETELLSNNYSVQTFQDAFGEHLNILAHRYLQSCEGQELNTVPSVLHKLVAPTDLNLKAAILADTCDDPKIISEKFVNAWQPQILEPLPTRTLDLNCGATKQVCGPDLRWDDVAQSCVSLYGTNCQTGFVKAPDGTCVQEPSKTITCDTNFHFDAYTKQCQPNAIICDDGYQLNMDKTACEPMATTCPDGARLDVAKNICIYDAVCPANTYFDVNSKSCVYEVLGCHDGTILLDNQCVHEVLDCPVDAKLLNNQCVFDVADCPDNTTFNAETNQCVYPIRDAKCPIGSTLNSDLDVCVFPAVCPDGAIYNDNLRECIYKASVADCPDGTELNLKLNQCVYPIAECSGDMLLNRVTNQCEIAKLACPDGTRESLQGGCIAVVPEKELLQQCPQGTLAGYKGECISPVNTIDSHNVTNITKVYNTYNCCDCLNAETGVLECPEGYAANDTDGACYQLLDGQTYQADSTALQSGVDTDGFDGVNVDQGEIDADQDNALDGGFFASGGVLGCTLNARATAQPAGGLSLMALAMLVVIRGVTSLKLRKSELPIAK